MKKLFVLTSLIFLMPILDAADKASVIVDTFSKNSRPGRPLAPTIGPELQITVDLNHDTLASLAQKIDNNHALKADTRFNDFNFISNVISLGWDAATGYSCHSPTGATLHAMGIVNGQHITAYLERMEAPESLEIKEPGEDW